MKMVHAFCLHMKYLCMPKCSMSEFNSGNRDYQHQAATSRHTSKGCLLPPVLTSVESCTKCCFCAVAQRPSRQVPFNCLQADAAVIM